MDGKIQLRKKKRSRKKCGAKASITVEAVFVLPFVMILFLMLLWLGLYLHDRSVIEGALFQTLEEGGEYILYGLSPGSSMPAEDGGSRRSLHYALAPASEEETQTWEERFCREISGKLFLYRLAEFECRKTVTGTRAYARFCCADFFPAGQWGLSELFSMEFKLDRVCPAREEATRAGSVLLELYEEKKK